MCGMQSVLCAGFSLCYVTSLVCVMCSLQSLASSLRSEHASLRSVGWRLMPRRSYIYIYIYIYVFSSLRLICRPLLYFNLAYWLTSWPSRSRNGQSKGSLDPIFVINLWYVTSSKGLGGFLGVLLRSGGSGRVWGGVRRSQGGSEGAPGWRGKALRGEKSPPGLAPVGFSK